MSKILFCEDVFHVALASLHDQDAAHNAPNTLQLRSGQDSSLAQHRRYIQVSLMSIQTRLCHVLQ